MRTRIFMLLLAVLVLAGCGREKKIESELLGIEEKDGYTLVTVRDPWKAGQTLHRYALVPRDKPLPDGLPDATVIKVPLRSAVVYSDVYARPIVELGCGCRFEIRKDIRLRLVDVAIH